MIIPDGKDASEMCQIIITHEKLIASMCSCVFFFHFAFRLPWGSGVVVGTIISYFRLCLLISDDDHSFFLSFLRDAFVTSILTWMIVQLTIEKSPECFVLLFTHRIELRAHSVMSHLSIDRIFIRIQFV